MRIDYAHATHALKRIFTFGLRINKAQCLYSPSSSLPRPKVLVVLIKLLLLTPVIPSTFLSLHLASFYLSTIKERQLSSSCWCMTSRASLPQQKERSERMVHACSDGTQHHVDNGGVQTFVHMVAPPCKCTIV